MSKTEADIEQSVRTQSSFQPETPAIVAKRENVKVPDIREAPNHRFSGLRSLKAALFGGAAVSTTAASQTVRDDSIGSPDTPAARASRFIQMAGIGATQQAIDEVVLNGAEAWLDQQLEIQDTGTRFGFMVDNGFTGQQGETLRGVTSAVWYKAFTANNQVVQRWVLALSELFVINTTEITGRGGNRGFGGAALLDLFEEKGLGTYRELLEEVTLSSQMGEYLSLRGSRRTNGRGSAPDENYAREVLQLFSIGLHELNINGTLRRDSNGEPIETFNNDDITGLARALTGWDFSGRSFDDPEWHRRKMVARRPRHDRRAQTFLNTTIPRRTDAQAALEIALDTISNHPNVAPFLSEQFIKRLVTSNPSAEYVERVANVFNDDGNGVRGNLKAVLKAVLLDEESQGSSPFGGNVQGKLREPMLRLMQWGRTFGVSDRSGRWRVRRFEAPDQLAQSPLFSPSVFNFFRPGYRPPNTELGQQGYEAPELQITNEVTVIGYANLMAEAINRGFNTIRPNYQTEIQLARNPVDLVNHLNLLLTANQLRSETYNLIVDTVESMPGDRRRDRNQRVYAAILMIMVSPDYLVLT